MTVIIYFLIALCILNTVYSFLITPKAFNYKLIRNHNKIVKLFSNNDSNDTDRDDNRSNEMDTIDSVQQFSKQSLQFGADDDSMGSNYSIKIDITRFITYNLLALVIAFGANFLGISTAVMSNTNPEYFRSIKLDQLYSIDGYRRYVDNDDKYEFLFPSNWVIDQTVLLNKVQENDIPQSLRSKRSTLPDVAYGPQGGSGLENISVVKSTVMPGFNLKTVLGTPEDAANRLLSTVIAPSASGKVYELIKAFESTRQQGTQPAYTFEYTVRNDEKKFFQHTVSVVMSRGTELYTFTATVPEKKWNDYSDKIHKIAESFDLSPSVDVTGFY